MPRMRRDANADNLLELPLEGFKDAIGLVNHALKRKEHWQTLYGLASVAESYARGDFDIHLHLRLKKLHGGNIEHIDSAAARLVRRYICNPTDLCIRAQRHPGLEVNHTSETAELHLRWRRGHNRDEAMFVGIVQLLQKIKGVLPVSVPSLVWLKPSERCNVPFGNAVDHAQPVRKVLPFEMWNEHVFPSVPESFCLAHQEDRELRVERGPPVIGSDKLIDNSIQGRPQIVGDLPDQERPFYWELLRPTLDSKTMMVGLRIVLGYADFIEVIPEEALNTFLEGYDLALCPLDLSEWPTETMHGVYSHHEQRRRPADTEDPEGPRNPHPQAEGLHARSEEGREALNSEASPEEVAPQTERVRPCGDCNATHTRLGSPEDA